jgi:hypothetical protein
VFYGSLRSRFTERGGDAEFRKKRFFDNCIETERDMLTAFLLSVFDRGVLVVDAGLASD